MNRKQLTWIALLLALAVLLYLPRAFSGGEGGGSVAAGEGFRFRISDPITRVDVIRQDVRDTIRLERTPDGWTVDGWAADEAKVDDLLEVLPDLGSGELVARNPANHAQLGVGDDTGRRIEVYSESGGPLTFLLGDRDVAAEGYFVREPGEDGVFRLDSPAAGYLGRDRDGWRPRLIAAVDTASVREIIAHRGEAEVVVRRSGPDWTVNGAEADTSLVLGMLRMLPGLSATGFPTDEEAALADFSSSDASLDVFAQGASDVTDRELVLSLRLIEEAEEGDWLARRAGGTEVYRLADYAMRRLLPEDLFP